MDTTRHELRAAAARLPYSTLEWLAQHDDCPPMHRAEARRQMRRILRRERQWFVAFMARRNQEN